MTPKRSLSQKKNRRISLRIGDHNFSFPISAAVFSRSSQFTQIHQWHSAGYPSKYYSVSRQSDDLESRPKIVHVTMNTGKYSYIRKELPTNDSKFILLISEDPSTIHFGTRSPLKSKNVFITIFSISRYPLAFPSNIIGKKPTILAVGYWTLHKTLIHEHYK